MSMNWIVTLIWVWYMMHIWLLLIGHSCCIWVAIFFFTKWMMGKNLSFKKKCSTISESDQKETMAVAIWVFCCQWYVHTWWGAKSFGICVNEPRVVFSPRLLSILCRSKNCRTVYLANMQSCMSPPLHATLFCFPKQKRNFSRNRKWQIDSIHYRSTQKA